MSAFFSTTTSLTLIVELLGGGKPVSAFFSTTTSWTGEPVTIVEGFSVGVAVSSFV